MPIETKTMTLSDAMKNHLQEISGDDGPITVTTLHGAVRYLLENEYEEERSLEGYDEKLMSPIKMPVELHERMMELRDSNSAWHDYDAVIRDRANIKERDVGEKPVEVTKL
jgi:hypothetical protein